MSIKHFFSILSTFLFLLWMSGTQLIAQCSQCKAAAASGEAGEVTIFGGINVGVLYLLALPILLPLIIGGIWWWRHRQAQSPSAHLN